MNQLNMSFGVTTTFAAVERMFSLSGNIFSQKRRRTTGGTLYEDLVFYKLNECLLD